jgi:hypothetical protein
MMIGAEQGDFVGVIGSASSVAHYMKFEDGRAADHAAETATLPDFTLNNHRNRAAVINDGRLGVSEWPTRLGSAQKTSPYTFSKCYLHLLGYPKRPLDPWDVVKLGQQFTAARIIAPKGHNDYSQDGSRSKAEN